MSELQEKAYNVQNKIEHMLSENTRVVMEYFRGESLSQGGLLRCPEDMELQMTLLDIYDDRDSGLEASLEELKDLFEKRTYTQVYFYKEKEPEIIVFEAQNFVEKIKEDILEIKDDWDATEIYVKASFDLPFNDPYEGFEVEEGKYFDGKWDVSDYSGIKTDLEFLHYCLTEKPAKIHVKEKDGQVIIESDIEMKDLGIGLIQSDGENKEDNSRVLRFIQGDQVGKDFISYSYLSGKETRRFVDFTGNLVKAFISIDDYIQEAKAASSEKELIELFHNYKEKVYTGLKEQAKSASEPEMREALGKLLSLDLRKICFEKTSFDTANQSEVLREYMFFLGMLSSGKLYMDIYQSDTPDLTEVFWLLPEIPETNWSDMTSSFQQVRFHLNETV